MHVSTSISRAISALTLLVLSTVANADERDRLKVGLQPDGRIVVPTNQILKPAGRQVTFPGRPVDLLLIEDGKTLVAKNMRDLVFIDPATGAVKKILPLPAASGNLSAGFSEAGLVAPRDGGRESDPPPAGRRGSPPSGVQRGRVGGRRRPGLRPGLAELDSHRQA